MIGIVSAMPSRVSWIVGVVLGLLVCATATARDEFKLDPQKREEMRVRSEMRNLHRAMMLAENNLSAAVTQRDNARLLLINEYLGLATSKLATPDHPCREAVQGLHEAVVAVGFMTDPSVMTVKIDDEKTASLRPDHGVIRKWYEDGFAKYANDLPTCEEQISVAKTRRLIPDKFPWTN